LSIFPSALSCRPKVYSEPFVRHHLSSLLGHREGRDRQLSSPPSNVISVRSIGKLQQTVELELEPGYYAILCALTLRYHFTARHVLLQGAKFYLEADNISLSLKSPMPLLYRRQLSGDRYAELTVSFPRIHKLFYKDQFYYYHMCSWLPCDFFLSRFL
jgi:hypothetical protein